MATKFNGSGLTEEENRRSVGYNWGNQDARERALTFIKNKNQEGKPVKILSSAGKVLRVIKGGRAEK